MLLTEISLDPKTKAHSVDVFSDSDPLITALALRKKGPGVSPRAPALQRANHLANHLSCRS